MRRASRRERQAKAVTAIHKRKRTSVVASHREANDKHAETAIAVNAASWGPKRRSRRALLTRATSRRNTASREGAVRRASLIRIHNRAARRTGEQARGRDPAPRLRLTQPTIAAAHISFLRLFPLITKGRSTERP